MEVSSNDGTEGEGGNATHSSSISVAAMSEPAPTGNEANNYQNLPAPELAEGSGCDLVTVRDQAKRRKRFQSAADVVIPLLTDITQDMVVAAVQKAGELATEPAFQFHAAPPTKLGTAVGTVATSLAWNVANTAEPRAPAKIASDLVYRLSDSDDDMAP